MHDVPSAENPLLAPTFRIPFDVIRAEHVVPAVAHCMAEARSKLAAIGAIEDPRDFDGTLGALEAATEHLEWVMGVASHLEGVTSSDELREAMMTVRPQVSELYAAIPHDTKLWATLKRYAESPDAGALDGPKARLLRKTIEEFRRHGADLSEERKASLLEVVVQLSEVTTRFGQNVLDATNAWELVITDEARLSGLPSGARAAAAQSARERGVEGHRFTLHEPSLVPLLGFLDDAQIREQVWTAQSLRATAEPWDNRDLVVQILALRRRQAELLGFGDFADFVLEDRMAHDGATVRTFLADLRRRTEMAFQREREELHAFRRELEGEDAPPPKPSDVAYYAEKMRKAKYDFDEEDLRPYFSLERVLDGMFEIASRLYGIEIRATDDLPTWDPEVRTYEVVEPGDARDDHPLRRVGAFYADLHPRENKRGGAWMQALVTGGPGEPHLGLFCANLTRPQDDLPALLTHREVETLFHEFGHLLHHLLTRVPVRSLAGTRVAWDFVELPSQIMENWTFEREALELFARHHQTGEVLPRELFDRMDRARRFRGATAMMRQLGFATTDLALHLDYRAAHDGDILEFARAAMQPFAAATLPPGYGMICGFTHLFAQPLGYAAGYYSYKWAEVLDADAFTVFRRAGIFDAAVGRRFRDTILARGDADDPLVLYRDFMGRAPDLEALLVRSGLAEAQA